MKNSVLLTAGDTRVELYPDLGGAVASFTWRGKDVFRPSPADAKDVLETANFALVPYCNRIPGGNFEFGGHKVHEKYDRNSRHGEVSILVARRFAVDVSGDNVSIEDLERALSTVDLSALEAMKDAGATE